MVECSNVPPIRRCSFNIPLIPLMLYLDLFLTLLEEFSISMCVCVCACVVTQDQIDIYLLSIRWLCCFRFCGHYSCFEIAFYHSACIILCAFVSFRAACVLRSPDQSLNQCQITFSNRQTTCMPSTGQSDSVCYFTNKIKKRIHHGSNDIWIHFLKSP